MFPPSLHKNIRELDKQITLLESECENMDGDKRKNPVSNKMYMPRRKESVVHGKKTKDVERPFVTGPRIPDAGLTKKNSASAAKIYPKSAVNGTKKILSNRESSTVTSEYEYGKKYSKNCPICGSERPLSGSKRDRKSQGVTNCVCGRELSNDFDKDFYETDEKLNDSENEKQVLHKGVLHANPGGTIEVTVTQKTNKTPISGTKKFLNRNSAPVLKSTRKSEGDSFISKESSNKNKTPRGQKWCEILCQESTLNTRIRSSAQKNNEIKSNSSLNNKFLNHCEGEPKKYNSTGDTHVKVPNLKFNIQEKDFISEFWNDENECPDSPVSSTPREFRQKSPLKRKNMENVIDASPRRGRNFEEKGVQWGGDDIDKSCLSEESYDPLKTLYNLIDALKGSFNEEEVKQLLSELELCLQKVNQEETKRYVEDKTDVDCDSYNQQRYVKKLQKNFLTSKKLCDKLLMEKNKLMEDLAVKDKLLSNLTNKEKEYLSTITNLKVNLEKKKVQAEDNIEILKELNLVKNKLLNETKVADALRKSHAKMQEQVQKCMLENDKLKTEIRLNKLESQKFCVLLAGKDAEIKRYKDEVESFQRQITEQLAALRSNNAANEVQKAMEAIIQHSQGFSVTDLDSAFSETQTDDKVARSSSKHRDKLMHSSPTSTKSSVLDSSWNHISSIHEDDTRSQDGFEQSEVLVKDLIPKDAPAPEDDSDMKNAHSFVSCKSAMEDVSRSEDADAVKNGSLAGPWDGVGSVLDDNKLRKNIEDLFEDFKMKCTQRIFSISSDSVNFDDLFNSSETSDLSEVSCSLFHGDGKGKKS